MADLMKYKADADAAIKARLDRLKKERLDPAIGATVSQLDKLVDQIEGINDPSRVNEILAHLAAIQAAIAGRPDRRRDNQPPATLDELRDAFQRVPDLPDGIKRLIGRALCDPTDTSHIAVTPQGTPVEVANLRAEVSRLRGILRNLGKLFDRFRGPFNGATKLNDGTGDVRITRSDHSRMHELLKEGLDTTEPFRPQPPRGVPAGAPPAGPQPGPATAS